MSPSSQGRWSQPELRVDLAKTPAAASVSIFHIQQRLDLDMLLLHLLLSSVTVTKSQSVALSRRQYDPGNEINCKDYSFSYPEFYLYDPSYTIATKNTTGDVGFSAYNIATNITFDCYARGVDLSLPANATEWHDCSVPATQFSFSVLSNSFGLRQTWICDNAPELTFVANGSVELPDALGCNSEAAQRWCLYGNNAIYPSLSSPVAIKPFAAWYPRTPYEYPDRCVERSDYPMWEIHDLTFNHTSSQQTLSVTIVNVMNGGKLSCTVALNEDLTRADKHASRWNNCTNTSQVGSEVSATQILFDHDYGLLGIKQTWKCHDNVAANGEPDTYIGLGYLVSLLRCTRASEYEGEVTSDQLSYTCSLPTTNISGYAAYDFPPQMPHTSYTHSCMMNSINSTELLLQDYETGGNGLASFTVYNPGPGDTYAIQNLTVPEDGLWHTCQGALPWQLVTCDYLFNRSTSKVGFRFQWYCDDRDPSNAYVDPWYG
ncbi:hypothetical protein CONLIGDRAFT_707936 [Coniochaeta ligniaria NRRL 30616]|uniref:AA1-like domain-containing protein n=1 Tax=Coniochaeta ligniaria NRRL 30616 TaxID=1408157 RepID=A0A1J7IH75_9PEZI|nr:hypothetical protein CONLIGDRAFT_707936 [Coniochaeta ligniaria NRRL 30616]